jgi:hypothetical protein
MGIEDVTEKPGFWILGVAGTIMVLLGWILSKKQDWIALPLWQVVLMVIIVWVASVFFAAGD